MNYENGITLITPTGNRPLALSRCIYYMMRQTHQFNQWIIVDDGHENFPQTFPETSIKYIRSEFNKNKAKSLSGNLIKACQHIKYDKIFIIEDDDWYSPRYLEKSIERFSNSQSRVIGEKFSVYYNVRSRSYRTCRNDKQSSLFQTAFRSDFLCKFKKYCEVNRRSAFIDKRIWNHCRENNIPYSLFNDEKLSIGIKGLPGRNGIGIGHRMDTRNDSSWKRLIQLIGKDDAQFYMDLDFRKI